MTHRFLFLAALVLAAFAGCAGPGAPEDPALAEGLPPTGRDPRGTAPFDQSYRDLQQHTHYQSGAAEDPCLSPDGRTLFFASTHDTRDYNVYAKPLGAGSVTRLTSGPGNERQPRVSPDGKWLVYVGDETSRWEIYLLSLAGAEPPRRLDTGPGDKYGPSWSPDGRRIVYSAYSEQTGRFQLWIQDLATGRSTGLDDRVPGLLPAFAPDGTWIAFHKFKDRDLGYASLWRIRPDGTEATVILTDPSWGAIAPTWSPDGKWIAFATVGKSAEHRGVGYRADDIWAVGVEGGPLAQLTSGPASDWAPSWHGGRIYFASDRSGTPNIFSLPADPK